MSDNACSLPPWLSWIFDAALASPAVQRACREHDVAYRRGGSERDRALADARLLVKLLRTTLWEWAEAWYLAVRQYGGSHWGGGAWMWVRNEVPEA